MSADFEQDSMPDELNDATLRSLERLRERKAREMQADFEAEEKRKREEDARLRQEERGRIERDTVAYLRRSGRKEMLP